MYLSFIWTSREKKTCSFGDKATNSEANSVRYVRFFLHFSSGRLIEAFVLPRIVQTLPFLASKSGTGRLLEHGLLLETLRYFRFSQNYQSNQHLEQLLLLLTIRHYLVKSKHGHVLYPNPVISNHTILLKASNVERLCVLPKFCHIQ